MLKVGHHGSASSSSLAFLQAADPEVGVISAGLNNQFGHPAPEVLARLASVGANIVSTDTTVNDDSVTMNSDCNTYSFSVTPEPPATPTATATSTTSPTTTATATATTGAFCSSTNATITGLNKTGNPEVVTIAGNGSMTGWYVISESGNQRFNFPAGYQLNGSVQLQSGPNAISSPPGILLWTTGNIWNNTTDDDAFLYDCNDTLRSTFEDGKP
ncbi:hypothetical protein AYO38_02590 [bacterium SCGC AG-212-C10]|nr:hypothetical protein AYO38_02590 [bacterium SCGC AG-212-C10]